MRIYDRKARRRGQPCRFCTDTDADTDTGAGTKADASLLLCCIDLFMNAHSTPQFNSLSPVGVIRLTTVLTALFVGCQQSSPGADAAVDACIRAMDAALTSDASAGDRAESISAGCASLYAEAECRRAH